MSKNIVALVGLAGSGKSLASKYFESRGYKRVYFGKLTLEELKRRGKAITPENEKEVREGIRAEHGMGAYALLSSGEIDNLLSAGKKVIIDGLYSLSEYKILKQRYREELFVLALYSPKALRYKRLYKRESRPLKQEEVDKRDIEEVEKIEKGGPIALADYTLLNESEGKDKLDESLDNVCRRYNL